MAAGEGGTGIGKVASVLGSGGCGTSSVRGSTGDGLSRSLNRSPSNRPDVLATFSWVDASRRRQRVRSGGRNAAVSCRTNRPTSPRSPPSPEARFSPPGATMPSSVMLRLGMVSASRTPTVEELIARLNDLPEGQKGEIIDGEL